MQATGRYVAVDCHRQSRYVVIAAADGSELLRRRLGVSAQDEAALLALLQPNDQVVLEATTGAHRLANRLESTGAVVQIADPQQARLVGLRGKKTDYRDCLALLKHLRAGELEAIWRPDLDTRRLRQLTRERQAYNQSIVRLKNRVRALLWEEGLDAPSGLWGDAGAQWLREQALDPRVRRIVERERAALRALQVLKEAEEAELREVALASPAAQRLMQLVGFGPATAVMVLGEIGDLGRFPTAKHLVSYAGLDPRVHQSGEFRGGGSVSKAGRSPLRWLLVEAAWTHVREHGPEAGYFHRLVAKGKAPAVAIVALARRLLVLAYLLLTRQATYRELVPAQYEQKLVRLGAHRPVTSEAQESNVAWGAARFAALTGQPSPHQQAYPDRPPRPRVVRRAGAMRQGPVGGPPPEGREPNVLEGEELASWALSLSRS